MTQVDSSQSAAQNKPQKPYPDFPLFPHATKRWAKKIRGRLIYFGPWDDPQGALEKYEAQKDALFRGLTPADTRDELTVHRLCGRFLTAKKRAMEEGEITPSTFAQYAALCKRLQQAFGKGRLLADLRPTDFEKFRARMARTWGPVRLKAEIVRSRTPFNWAYKSGLLDRPIVFGEGFKVPSLKTIRKQKASQVARMFQAKEIRAMIEAARPALRAMVLLGVNCGFGNADVAALPVSALDLESGWVNFARVKTGISRRCPLWPETAQALREWLARRPKAKEQRNAGLVFLTVKGNTWTNVADGAISKEFRKLMDEVKLEGKGRAFYALRHVCQTIGDEARDPIATKHIMGHATTDISDVYRELIGDERLKAVVERIRSWLFAKE